ncbi:MAG: hypothetical protein WBA16_10770, partial [Nonlabens sp.]
MKYNIFSFFFCLITCSIQAQFSPIDVNYVVEYKLTFRPIPGEDEFFEDIPYVLVVGESKSLFTEKNNFTIDTTLNNSVSRGENPMKFMSSFTNLPRVN